MSSQNHMQIWVLPYPVHGHINPMLQFSKRLASKSQSLTLTFLLPTSKSNSFQPGSIHFKPISDGAHEHQTFNDIASYMDQFNRFVPHSLDELIRQELETTNPRPPLRVLVYDSVTPWALDVARRYGLIGAAFFAQNCFVSAVYYRFSVGKMSDSDDVVGALPELETRDLPSFLQDENSPKTILEMLASKFRNLHEAEFVFFNTFDKLEEEVVEWMRRQWRIMTIGPTIPSMYLDKRLPDDKDYGLSLLKPDVGLAAAWLDNKTEHEVVYVSFGSLANVDKQQIHEVAWALRYGGFSFLWVVREAEQKKLPSGFVEEVLEKGLVVSWCSQLDVLSHRSVGCFVTHCGWNSVLEAISLGVPIVGLPQFSDQPTNAKFVQDVWKVGIRVGNDSTGKLAGRDQIQRCIREVMNGGDEAKLLRENANKWKRLSREAVDKGGSSDKNIDQFVAHVLSR
ncbi:hypothetical protein QQ045_020269 [Rhodiola kirilowii]